MSSSRAITHRVGAAALTLVLLASGCGSDESEAPSAADKSDAVATYADGVHAAYRASVDSAAAMDTAIDTFLADPTESTLQAAKDAWLAARDDYGPTEAFRFYDGPIDNPDDGPEGLVNAWPMDESYVDYVEGAPGAGIINDVEGYPVIDAEVLLSLNEQGGETNISTGWHAIEFLLWGQDLSLDGPGARPATDFTTAPNAERRGTYLAVATDLLLGHLEWLRDSWAPDAENFRADFVAGDVDDALTDIITGIGELSRGELAGERMNVAYSERSQEDEHSCFSDNTTADIVGNARGIEMVLAASYPGGVTGTSILDLVDAADSELADQLEAEVEASLTAVRAIPAPFDQHLVDGVSDDDPGRASILTAIELLENQTDTIVDAATAIGVAINVS